MVGMDPRHDEEALVRELMAKAAELWGRERAEAIRSTLQETARNIRLVAQDPPGQEQEPAFYL